MTATNKARATRAIIPAAGRGTRFLPVTKSVPKELLPIVSTPAIELVVAEASRNGLADVLLVISAGKQAVADYFGPDPDLEEAIRGKPQQLEAVRRAIGLAHIHQTEQTVPRGLGDAVAHGEEFSNGGPVVVLLPDDLIDERDELLSIMLDTQAEHGGIVLGLIDIPREEIKAYGVVELAAGTSDADDIVTIVDLVEKPEPAAAPSTLAVIGRYVLPPEIFDALRSTEPGALGEIQLTDAMRALVQQGVPVHGVIFRGRRYDTGNPLNYLQATVQIARRHPDVGTEFTAWLREYVETMDATDESQP